MSDAKKERRAEKEEKKRRKEEKAQKKQKKEKLKEDAAPLSLLADETAVNPLLSSLFAAKPTPPQPAAKVTAKEPDREASSDSEVEAQNETHIPEPPSDGASGTSSVSTPEPDARSNRKRKRKDGEEIEDKYMQRLAREEAKEAESLAREKSAKRQKTDDASNDSNADEEDGVTVEVVDEDVDEIAVAEEDDEDAMSPPPRHETEVAAEKEASKANRTVFLGNVSTSAISSKVARKNLISHLKSFFKSVAAPKDGEPKHAVESIRFRSTPYASAIPKKAAFAKKELMDATTKSTNAYAVYSTPQLAREACKHLNATVVLGRHLRVDLVAHPAKVDNKRCVFVGNLGFVDDESNIQAANEEEGHEKRKPGKTPADVEEGLWRTFGECGQVESVRVIRDSTTRVGKGIAYVQFEDANAVEEALLLNEKKFPPMLPRKLRVARARAQKRNPKPGSSAPSARPKTNGYQRKITGQEASKLGRAGKLYGRAAASQMKHASKQSGNDIKTPESFVFEGHRASSKGGKAGLKLGGKGKKKPTTRSAKRGAAFKAKGKPKAK